MPRITLNDYIDHCKVLMRDVTHALADYDAHANGWALRYAVDFSEIYSYVVPGESHEHAPIGDGWSNDPDRQFYVLSRFFGRRNILLPEPYAVELAGFVDLVGSREFSGSARGYLRARKDVANILKLTKTKQILQRASAGDDRALTDPEANELFEFFESYAPTLVAFARGVDLSPFQRLRDLFLQHTFTPLEKEYPQLGNSMIEENTRRRFEQLSKWRIRSNPAANLIDARALSQVEAVNEILQKREEKTRVFLISRSEQMMRIAIAERGDGIVYVRHPRTMSISYRSAEGEMSLADDVELSRRRHSIEAFISSAEQVREKLEAEGASEAEDVLGVRDEAKGKTLRELLEDIQSVWHNVEAYATGLTKSGETRSKKGSRKDLAIEVLAYLRDPLRLRSRIVAKIKSIFSEVSRNRDSVAFYLQRETAGRGSIVYPIHFGDQDLKEKTEELSAQWSSTLDDAMQIFDVAIDAKDDYDWLLGIAVSLGAIGRWPLASQYIDNALAVRPTGDQREARFLQAATARRLSIEDESLTQAMKRMHNAVEIVEALIKEAEPVVDSRYYNERAALKLWLIEFARNPEGASIAKQQPTYEPAQVAAELGKALPQANGKLKIQILNNLCYAYLLDEDVSQMPQALDALRDEVTQAYSDRTNWPIVVLDTVVYASFRLQRKKATVSQLKGSADEFRQLLKGWADELRAITEQDGISNQERRLIGGHANEIQEAASA